MAAALAAVNFFYGYAEDSDTSILITRAWKFGALGYGPNRNWGFPLYELFAYPLLFYFGIAWTKFFSFVCYALSGGILFYLILFCSKDRWAAFLGTLCFLVHPLAVLNGNSITESSLAILFSVTALYALAKYLSDQKCLNLCAAAFFCGLASAARQDYLMLSGAAGLTALIFGERHWKKFAAAFILFLLAAVGPYIVMYGPDHLLHLNTEFLEYDPYLRKLARAGFGVFALFGWSVLLSAPVLFFRRKTAPPFIRVLFVLTAVFYFLRYTLNADKLEYILGFLPVFILFASLTLSRRGLVWLALAIFLPGLVQIHLFRRDGRQTRVAIGFSPGVFVQERSERLKQEYMFLGEYKAVLKEAAEKKFGCKKHIIYLLDVEDPDLCMVVQEERLRFWNPERAAGKIDLQKAFSKRIIVYPLPDHRGWRQWIRFTPWHKPSLDDFSLLNHYMP